MCHIHLDTYNVLLKQAYDGIVDVCNPCSTYVVYDAARIKIYNTLKEADTIIKSSYYKNLPIFYTSNHDDVEDRSDHCPTSIKFPLFIFNDIQTENKIDIELKYSYFKIKLMKVSLKHINLDRYCKPPLNKGEILKSSTSPIPPFNRPVGKTPEPNMYENNRGDTDLVKCWDINYHMQQFENALYRVTIVKEILNNYSKLIQIKEELYHKITMANLK